MVFSRTDMKLSEKFLIKELGKGAQHIAGRVSNSYQVRLDGFPLEPEFGIAPVLKVPHGEMGGWDQSTPKDLDDDNRLLQSMEHIKVAHSLVMSGVTFSFVRRDCGQVYAAPYGILQEWVAGRELRESDFQVDSVRQKVRAMITEAAKVRAETGKGVDFIGFEAIHKLKEFIATLDHDLGVYNIRLGNDNSLTQIDTGMLDAERVRTWAKFHIKNFPWLQYQLLSLVLRPYEKAAEEKTPRYIKEVPLWIKAGAEAFYQLTRGVLAIRTLRKKFSKSKASTPQSQLPVVEVDQPFED